MSTTTKIGKVIGQVHTGSGDIHVGTFLATASVSTKDEFLTALREFKREVENAQKSGIPNDKGDDIITEIEATEREIKRDTPKLERITTRLKNTKDIIKETAEVATATGTTITALKGLMPYAEKLIEIAKILF